ncbi:hypothetical protein AC578_3673 [Pseudocercospora eumusae]|uniref:Uncharacterized protein n=1 Tax=Pseudocercospora eumusae TaxID=321146 RepID=A0A139GXD1_9PEZI|nr:hypothetical protein AC578_3673 [Pseudocercospora eumusae]
MPAISKNTSTAGKSQPWRAAWEQNKATTTTTDASAPQMRAIKYPEAKGSQLVSQGSAGEMNTSVLYDTDSK